MRKIAGFSGRFRRDQRGGNAVEFAILATPFFFLLLFIAQIGLYYMTKMALDSAVMRTAEDLQAAFSTGTTPVLPPAATVKSRLAGYSGGVIDNDSRLRVEVRPLSALTGSTVAVSNGTANYGSARTVLAVRARYVMTSFMPGFSSNMPIHSSALVRRGSQ